jgi:hypothetical protein
LIPPLRQPESETNDVSASTAAQELVLELSFRDEALRVGCRKLT